MVGADGVDGQQMAGSLDLKEMDLLGSDLRRENMMLECFKEEMDLLGSNPCR